jgi:hypothetical protein
MEEFRKEFRSKHNEFFVTTAHAGTHVYSFYSRGSCISPEYISAEDCNALWINIVSANTQGIDNLLQNYAMKSLLHSVFDAVQTPYAPVFLWSEISFNVTDLIPKGNELIHEGLVQSYITRQGFWASSADGLHTIRLIFGWQPNDDPSPQSMHIRYIGPQRFHTFDGEIGRLLKEEMQKPLF